LTILPESLPITLLLTILVGMFISVERRAPSARVRVWTFAWALTFLHFLARGFETSAGMFAKILTGVDFASLELAGILFLSSVMFKASDWKKRAAMIAALGAPLAAHAFAEAFQVKPLWIPGVLIAAAFFAGVVLSLIAPARRTSLRYAIAFVLTGLGSLAIHEQLNGASLFGVTAILTLLFGFSGVLFWRLYRRFSLGVMAVTVGFLGWAAVYATKAMLIAFAPNFVMHLDFANVPRLLVALGMVLTLFEDKSRAVEDATSRAQAETQLLERISRITSRLLAGNDPVTLCAEVAKAITETSSFSRTALFLLGEDRRFYLAGSSGFTPQEEETLREHSGGYAIESLKHRPPDASAGSRSFRMSEEGDLVLLPMISWRGSHVGCVYLAGSKDGGGMEASEMVKLEIFASDLAVTLENVRLHHQLVRSEKLAGLGQLVAGVAHELNNPLTGVLGYVDLLRDEVREAKVAARVEKLGNEARRMQRIVDGLLRFGRQNNSTLHSANLAVALRDVVQLREYHLSARGIHIKLEVDETLPPVGIGEDELKQVLLNILNNSIDAVSESVHRDIGVRASHRGGRILIQFDDSGPGFADLNRAFDPFYTTKPVGKGTGLGLSICYGIIHECSGEITLTNNQPYGARVAIDLPVAAPQTVLAPSPVQGQLSYPLTSKRAL
jgi:two-component system, NtrC family, sensor kinase